MCDYRALRGACSGDCGAHRLLKNSIQRSSPTKSCVLYRFVVSIGGFVDMNPAKSGDFWFKKIVQNTSPGYVHFLTQSENPCFVFFHVFPPLLLRCILSFFISPTSSYTSIVHEYMCALALSH